MPRHRAGFSRGLAPGRDALFNDLSILSRLHLFAAIFFTFATFGVLLCMMRREPHDPWWGVALWAVFSGCIALGWALSFMWRMWLLPVVLIVQMGLPPVLGSFIGNRWIIGGRLAFLGAVAIALVVIGYVLLTTFLEGQGRRRMRLQAELDLAQQIHRGIVPPIALTAGGLEVFGRSDASSEMGGDLIDVVAANGAVDLYLADVSGHGVRAGVVMAMVKSALRIRLLGDAALDGVIADLNRVVTDLSEPDMFVTFACLRHNGAGRVEYSLAGHLPILHHRAATGELVELQNESLPLGIMTDEVFTTRSTDCAPGDLFALLTDGLTETMNGDRAQLGFERIKQLIHKHAARPLEEIHDEVMRAVAAHGQRNDDQTLLLARVL